MRCRVLLAEGDGLLRIPPRIPIPVGLAILVGGATFILSLPLLGERGNDLVGALALLLAWAVAIVPLLAWEHLPRLWRTWSRWRRAGVLVALVALVIMIASAVYFLARVPPERVPGNDIDVEGADELSPTTPATIVFRSPTPDRENLGLRVRLDDYIGSGDCVTSPTLTLVPAFGGVQRPAVEVPMPGPQNQEGREVEIPLGGQVQNLRISVNYFAPEGCTVRLVVVDAEFYG